MWVSGMRCLEINVQTWGSGDGGREVSVRCECARDGVVRCHRYGWRSYNHNW